MEQDIHIFNRYRCSSPCNRDRGRCNASAKAIDGIYDSDPKVNPAAVKYDEISIQEVIDQKLAAVDLTASILCLENKMPMLVFDLMKRIVL